MRGAWKRFVQMPDAERAMLLAKIAAVIVIVVLYSLGATSLYLRRHYLPQATGQPTQTIAPTITSTTAPTTQAPEATPATDYLPTPTLYPTITPSVDG